MLTIVMYHYVRDLIASRYPKIKGLDVKAFRGQLEYLRKHYRFTTVAEIIHAARSGGTVEGNAVLLTFDDGYADHYNNVFPLLDSMGIQGAFFPPSAAILDGVLLDVNKIHFILAAGDIKRVQQALVVSLDMLRREGRDIPEDKILFSNEPNQRRYDSSPVSTLKRLLQRELPLDVRQRVTTELFRKFVTADELGFARELYASVTQLKSMVRQGMYVGAHGATHCWLDSVSRHTQEDEIDASLKFMTCIGSSVRDWVMCYPYGAYNSDLMEVLHQRGCALALTTRVGLVDLSTVNKLALQRLDTNDLPCGSDAEPNQWTLLAQRM